MNLFKLFLFSLILICSTANAQEKIKAKLADKYFNQYAFADALPLYESLATSHDTNKVYIERTAECYRLTGNTEKAEVWYEKLIRLKKNNPKHLLLYAEMLESNGKFDEAQKYYDQFSAISSNDSRAKRKTNHRELKDFYRDSALYKITPAGFNSDLSDFGAVPYKSRIFFASNRQHETYVKHQYSWNNQPFLDIFEVLNGHPIISGKEINTSLHEGPICFDSVNNLAYLTRNNLYKGKTHASKEGVNKLKLFIIPFDGQKWGEEIEFKYDNDEYSMGHATVSADGKWIFFSSDMPGGSGGADIYVCERKDTGYTRPVNLGTEVNTEGNEMFPFISKEGELYFSSDGHFGLGGLDVFRTKNKGGSWEEPYNLGSPVNSTKDDFSFYLNADNKTGFFSSNRPGTKDDDIFSFTRTKEPEPVITIKTINRDTKDPIQDASVEIYNVTTNKTENLKTDASGVAVYISMLESQVKILGSKDKYEPDSMYLSIDRETGREKEIILFLAERKNYSIAGQVTNKETGAPVVDAIVTIKNLTTGQVIADTMDAEGNYSYVLEPNSDYVITAEKEKYFTSKQLVSTRNAEPGTKKMNLVIEEIVIGKAIKLENIYYDLGKWNIRPDAGKELDKLVNILKENPTIEIELSSHTDSRGSAQSNFTLSDKRAKSAAQYIISKGISKGRITGRGYGEDKLINHCTDNVTCGEDEHLVNRRTEFKVIRF